jgi:hypothetical protein
VSRSPQSQIVFAFQLICNRLAFALSDQSKADCQIGSRRKELETRIDKGDRASFSGPICCEYSQNCGNNRGFSKKYSEFSLQFRLNGGAWSLELTILLREFPANREKYREFCEF